MERSRTERRSVRAPMRQTEQPHGGGDSVGVETELVVDALGPAVVGDEAGRRAQHVDRHGRRQRPDAVGDAHPDAAVADAVLARDRRPGGGRRRRACRRRAGRSSARPTASSRCRSPASASAAFSAASTSLPMASTQTRSSTGSVGGPDPPGPDADADLVLGDLAGLAPGVADGDRAAVGEESWRRAASAAAPGRWTGPAPACPARGRASPCRRRRGGWARPDR